MGYDNTEISYRALSTGSRIVVDDTNVAKCINIWPVVMGTNENVFERERLLNPPRYKWFVNQMKSGKLPLVRDIKVDESIKLSFEVPKKIKDKDSSKWITDHTDEIVRGWEENARSIRHMPKKRRKDKN